MAPFPPDCLFFGPPIIDQCKISPPVSARNVCGELKAEEVVRTLISLRAEVCAGKWFIRIHKVQKPPVSARNVCGELKAEKLCELSFHCVPKFARENG